MTCPQNWVAAQQFVTNRLNLSNCRVKSKDIELNTMSACEGFQSVGIVALVIIRCSRNAPTNKRSTLWFQVWNYWCPQTKPSERHRSSRFVFLHACVWCNVHVAWLWFRCSLLACMQPSLVIDFGKLVRRHAKNLQNGLMLRFKFQTHLGLRMVVILHQSTIHIIYHPQQIIRLSTTAPIAPIDINVCFGYRNCSSLLLIAVFTYYFVSQQKKWKAIIEWVSL